MMNFKNLPIGLRIWAPVLLLIAALLLLGAYSVRLLGNAVLDSRKAQVQSIVQTATGIIERFHDEVKAGRLSEEEGKRLAFLALDGMRYGENGQDYIFVSSADGVNVVNPNKAVLGKSMSGVKDPNGIYFAKELIEIAHKGGGFVAYSWNRPGTDTPSPKISYGGLAPSWDLMVGTGIYINDVDTLIRDLALQLASVAGLIIIIALGLAGVAIRSVVSPLRGLTTRMNGLAKGDIEATVSGDERKDEIGAMAKALLVFRDNARDKIRLEAQQEENAHRAEAERLATMSRIANDFEASVGDIVAIVVDAADNLRSVAKTITEMAEMGSQSAATVAGAALEASTNVQTVAAASEELSAAIAEIGQQVARSADISAEAVAEAGKANDMVQELSKTATRIGEVVTLINTIASQTNLLALNATIEAARAGEAGKGFAVVAGEVKALANQTAKATDEISIQINSIQQETRATVASIQGMGGTITNINQISSAIAAAVEEQNAATQEISRNVQLAADGTNDVSHNIGTVNQATTATATAAENLLAAAESLGGQSQRLRAEVQNFLKTVRAA